MDLLQGGIVMVNADLLLGLRPVDDERAGDRFDPFRCGLDHLCFGVAGRADLEAGRAGLRGAQRGARRHHRPAAVRHRGAAVQGP